MDKAEARAGRLAEAHLAFVFLTRLPLPRLSDAAARTAVGRAAWAFPLVGLAVGGLGALVLHGGAALGLPGLASALLALAATAWVTGALHEDGLADVADGFGGGLDKARKLEIMRDSRIGSYGVLAVVFSVGLRAAALVALLKAGGPALAAAALVAALTLSRAAIPLAMTLLGPAREDGLGAGAGSPGAARLGAAVALAGAVAWALLPGATLAPLFAFALMAVLAVVGLAARQIGGHTGDVLGTVEQVTAATALLVLTALLAPGAGA